VYQWSKRMTLNLRKTSKIHTWAKIKILWP
jgi:hypothetical protein